MAILPPPPQHATPVVGTLALLPLPGSDGWRGQWVAQKKALLDRAEQETYALLTAGVDAICVENSHDFPFSSNTVGRVDPAVTTLMTQIVNRVQAMTDKPIGISVLQNDPETALAIALATNAQFVRVPVLLGTRVTETGMMPSRLQALTAAYRRWRLSPDDVVPWVDVTMHHVLPIRRAHQPWANPVEYLADLVATVDAQALTGKIVLHWPDVMAQQGESRPNTGSSKGSELQPHPLATLTQATDTPILVEFPDQAPDSGALAPLCQYSAGVILGRGLARKPLRHNDEVAPAVEPFVLERLIGDIREARPNLVQV